MARACVLAFAKPKDIANWYREIVLNLPNTDKRHDIYICHARNQIVLNPTMYLCAHFYMYTFIL